MKFLESPAAVLVAMGVAILVFGIGLTTPIWLIASGYDPLQAIHTGTPVVTTAIIGLMVTVLLAVLATRLHKPNVTANAPVLSDHDVLRRHRMVHIIVMFMFIIPFLTIVLGYLLKSTIDFTRT